MRAAALALVLLTAAGCSRAQETPPSPTVVVVESPAATATTASTTSGPSWQLLASDLPEALLSVTGRSASDVYAVGADKGHGPLVLHFDGHKWTSPKTGTSGDLWWAQALPNGPLLLGGAHGTVLRGDGVHFDKLPLPAKTTHADATVYGVWGTSGDDFYAVGNDVGANGFVWHFLKGVATEEKLPRDLPRTSSGAPAGFFKVWGNSGSSGGSGDVWVVGTSGVVLHRTGTAPFAVVPSGTKETLFTVSGSGDRWDAVGGSGNGVVLARDTSGVHVATPAAAGLLQGVFVSDHGDWTSGERGAIYTRKPSDPAFTFVEHGLPLPPTTSLHAIWADDAGGVWSTGGDVLTTALKDGVLVHGGPPVPIVTLDD